MTHSTTFRVTGRDALSLLHRVTSNALLDLAVGDARATLWCDFRGRLLHRAVVARTDEATLWLLRADAPGAELAAAIDKSVFRDDVRIEDLSDAHPVALARGPSQGSGVRTRADGTPGEAWTGDGTRLVVGDVEPLSEESRIALLHPRHGHEIVETFNPFEIGLAHEVHLAKGCFTGQEALQRLITYDSVRRRPLHIRLPEPRAIALPADVHTSREKAGLLTSLAGREGFAIVRREPIANGDALSLADGTPLEVIAAPGLERPLGRP
jgi:folate-binding protein YgfZ